MDKLEFIPIGSRVKIIEAGIIGTVIAVCTYGNDSGLEYRVVFWVGGARTTEWMYHWEIEPHIETKKKAGMVDYETDTSKFIS